MVMTEQGTRFNPGRPNGIIRLILESPESGRTGSLFPAMFSVPPMDLVIGRLDPSPLQMEILMPILRFLPSKLPTPRGLKMAKGCRVLSKWR